MARWKLAAAHYLNVPGTDWEYKEVDRSTGKNIRRTFAVPLVLNPNDLSDCNYKNGDEGEIIVCMPDKGEPRDIVFLGDPTPDMIPLDQEATDLSASFAGKWKHPIDSLPGNYSQSLLDGLQREMAMVQSNQTQANTGSAGVDKLVDAMSKMMEQNQQLLMLLAGKMKPVGEAEPELEPAESPATPARRL